MRSARAPATPGCASPRPPPRTLKGPGDERGHARQSHRGPDRERPDPLPRVRVHRRSPHPTRLRGPPRPRKASSPDSSLAVTGNPAAYTAPAGCALPVVPIRIVDLADPAGRRRPRGLGAGRGAPVPAVGPVVPHRPAHPARVRAGIGDPRAPVREGRAAPRQPAPPRHRAPRTRPTSGGGSDAPAGWTCTSPSKTPSPSKAHPGPGKGYRVLISAIVDWSGPLITTSTTNDNLTATMRMRQQRGNVHVFDPQGLSGIRHPLRVSPDRRVRGPARRDAARQRDHHRHRAGRFDDERGVGASIRGGPRPAAARRRRREPIDRGRVQLGHQPRARPGTRSTSSAPTAHPAGATISKRPSAGDEKLVSSIWFGVQGAVAPLAVPQIRDALMPRPGDPVFDPREFLDAANTLYLIGSSSGAVRDGRIARRAPRRHRRSRPHPRARLPRLPSRPPARA